MKPIFTLAIALSFSIISSAQKSSWYLGGSAGFSSTQSKRTNPGDENTGKVTSWSFSPEIGTFVSDNIQIGAGLTFVGNNTNNQSSVNPSTNSSHLYGGSIYARKFWGKEAFKPFAGLQTSFLTGKNTSSNGFLGSEYTQTSFGANINAGFSYALSKRVTALGSFGVLGFEQTNSKQSSNDEKHRTTSFGFDVSSLQNRFNIGFYYTFKKDKK